MKGLDWFLDLLLDLLLDFWTYFFFGLTFFGLTFPEKTLGIVLTFSNLPGGLEVSNSKKIWLEKKRHSKSHSNFLNLTYSLSPRLFFFGEGVGKKKTQPHWITCRKKNENDFDEASNVAANALADVFATKAMGWCMCAKTQRSSVQLPFLQQQPAARYDRLVVLSRVCSSFEMVCSSGERVVVAARQGCGSVGGPPQNIPQLTAQSWACAPNANKLLSRPRGGLLTRVCDGKKQLLRNCCKKNVKNKRRTFAACVPYVHRGTSHSTAKGVNGGACMPWRRLIT